MPIDCEDHESPYSRQKPGPIKQSRSIACLPTPQEPTQDGLAMKFADYNQSSDYASDMLGEPEEDEEDF